MQPRDKARVIKWCFFLLTYFCAISLLLLVINTGMGSFFAIFNYWKIWPLSASSSYCWLFFLMNTALTITFAVLCQRLVGKLEARLPPPPQKRSWKLFGYRLELSREKNPKNARVAGYLLLGLLVLELAYCFIPADPVALVFSRWFQGIVYSSDYSFFYERLGLPYETTDFLQWLAIYLVDSSTLHQMLVYFTAYYLMRLKAAGAFIGGRLSPRKRDCAQPPTAWVASRH